MATLHLIPDTEQFSGQDAEAVLRAEVSGGPSRQRLDHIGAPAIVSLGFYLEAADQDYWRIFYRSVLQEGTAPFNLQMMLDSATLSEHRVKIVPGTVQMAPVGDLQTLTMSVEARTKPASSAGVPAPGGQPVIALVPTQDGYAHQHGESVLLAKLSAGESRQRLESYNPTSLVDCSFTLQAGEFEYMRNFMRHTLAEQSLPFRIDLRLDHPTLTRHLAQIVPGTSKIARRGDTFFVQFRIEARRQPAVYGLDEIEILLIAAYGPGYMDVLNQLEQLANVDLPGIVR